MLLTGCGTVGTRASPPGNAPATSPTPATVVPTPADQAVLQAALAAWAGFPVDASPRPLILLGGAQQTVTSPSFAFPNGDEKLAFLRGQIDPPIAWPASPGEAGGYRLITARAAFAEFMPPAGTDDPPTSTWLQTSSVQIGTASFESDRGPLQLPAWAFTFDGVPGSAAVLAAVPASLYPVPAPLSAPPGLGLAGSAQVGSDGRTLTVETGGAPSGSGPCDAQYSLQVASSDTAVAIAVDVHMNPVPSGQACAAIAELIQLTNVLGAPLGARVVVDARAEPVEITESS